MNLFPDKQIAIINARPENMQTRFDLDITIAEQIRIIKDLSSKNYCTGPMDDDKPARGLIWWVFGKKIKGREVYIKLSHGKHNEIPVCMSFHVANKKLEYPLNK